MIGRRLPILPVLALVAGLVASGCELPDDLIPAPDRPPPESSVAGVGIVAADLTVPWEVRFLPDGDLLVTERTGRLLRFAPGATSKQRLRVPEVEPGGEGGLMGLALHPAYPDSSWIYLCHTSEASGELTNRVIRYRYREHRIDDGEVILGGMPASRVHDGCRLEFGPDGLLYVTMGDAREPGRAQELDSPSGKIHRIRPDGTVPEENPFGTTVYSYGHRNPQGLAWDGEGRLWSTEHGPSGRESGYDELNLVRKGANYGWPAIRGSEEAEGMVSPVLQSGSETTWAPAGLAHREGRLYWAGLRGASLYELPVPADGARSDSLRSHFQDQFGRLRAVRLGPDGMLYLSTSNRDGWITPGERDDLILRVNPDSL